MAGNPYFDKFRKVDPNLIDAESGLADYTHVTCTHPYHGTKVYWIPNSQFQECLAALLVPFWINNYIVVINCQPS